MAGLDKFLGGPEEALSPAPEAPESPPQAATIEPKAPEPGAAAPPGKPPIVDPPVAAAASEPAKEPEPEDVTGLKSALLATRRERSDHKGRADRAEGEVSALKAQMEALRAEATREPAPAVAPPAAAPALDPTTDLQAYLFNERLNLSEAMLRQQHGDDDVNAKLAVFKKAVEANPALRAELSRQPHPYAWAYDQAKRMAALDEIGPDPNAYRAKLEAEIRAAIAAEAAVQPPAKPAASVAPVTLPGSLATARSAAPRAEVWSGPVPLGEIVKRRQKA